jgi:hypothetical protein
LVINLPNLLSAAIIATLQGPFHSCESRLLVLLDLADEMIERAGDVADRGGGNLRVARRRVELGMSEQS